MADKEVIPKEGDSLREDRVIKIEGRRDNSIIEDGISQDIDKEDFPLSDGKVKEMDRDFVGRGVHD